MSSYRKNPKEYIWRKATRRKAYLLLKEEFGYDETHFEDPVTGDYLLNEEGQKHAGFRIMIGDSTPREREMIRATNACIRELRSHMKVKYDWTPEWEEAEKMARPWAATHPDVPEREKEPEESE